MSLVVELLRCFRGCATTKFMRILPVLNLQTEVPFGFQHPDQSCCRWQFKSNSKMNHVQLLAGFPVQVVWRHHVVWNHHRSWKHLRQKLPSWSKEKRLKFGDKKTLPKDAVTENKHMHGIRFFLQNDLELFILPMIYKLFHYDPHCSVGGRSDMRDS